MSVAPALNASAPFFKDASPPHPPFQFRSAASPTWMSCPIARPSFLASSRVTRVPKWRNSRRRWKALRDFGTAEETQEDALVRRRSRLKANDGQSVATSSPIIQTMEYDLAFCGLGNEVYVAAMLAKNDDPLNEDKKTREDVTATALAAFADLEAGAAGDQMVLAVQVYSLFHSGAASKAIAAQYLAELLSESSKQEGFDTAAFAARLPRYIVDAIAHVSRVSAPSISRSSGRVAAMVDAIKLIPKVTDEDIEWVAALMGLDAIDEPRRAFLTSRSTHDVAACPGSGKTTLIVAKLAIFARKWPHRTKGICVLSHTNVAREEIQHRLGNTVVGQRLLGYPHFIDTIHGFVNRFLALPWLNSNGYPSPTIDDAVATAHRRGTLTVKEYKAVDSYLGKKFSRF